MCVPTSPPTRPTAGAATAPAPTAPAATSPPASARAAQQICGGACTDTVSDALNCGTCGHACAIDQACVSGSCQTPPDCTTQGCTGLNYCDTTTKTCLPGCDQDAQCTGGKTCDTGTHACVCPAGLTECNGTCVDLTSDGANCGTCGHGCTGTQVCLSSTCQDRGVTCSGYDATGRLASCGQSTPCQSSSFQCVPR